MTDTARPQIEVTVENYRRIKAARDEAVNNGFSEFEIAEGPLLVSYANYLLEYMYGILEAKDEIK